MQEHERLVGKPLESRWKVRIRPHMTWKLVHISVLQRSLSQETDKQAVAKLKRDYMDLLVISTMPEQKRLVGKPLESPNTTA